MPFPTVTAIACCLLVLLLVVLTIRVSILRHAEGVLLGTGNDTRLERAVRAHGNLTESAPTALMLILLLEVSGVSILVITGLAATYIVARLAHVAGILVAGRLAAARTLGAAGSLLVILAGGGLLARRLIGLL